MISIDRPNQEITIDINNLLYPEKAIEKAIADFCEYCYISKNNNIIKMKLRNNSDEIENLGFEFFNHLLGLINNKDY